MNTQAHRQAGFSAELVAVFVGGGVGTLLRFGLVEAFPADRASWPWHTFVANVVACAVLGFVVARRARGGFGGDARLALIGSGFCGGLSTFSAMQLEVYLMFDAGSYLIAAGYLAASIAAGLGMVSLARCGVGRGEDVA